MFASAKSLFARRGARERRKPSYGAGRPARRGDALAACLERPRSLCFAPSDLKMVRHRGAECASVSIGTDDGDIRPEAGRQHRACRASHRDGVPADASRRRLHPHGGHCLRKPEFRLKQESARAAVELCRPERSFNALCLGEGEHAARGAQVGFSRPRLHFMGRERFGRLKRKRQNCAEQL